MNSTTLPLNMPRRLIGAKELADKIGHAYDWVIRNWPRLTTEKGFPSPVFGGGVGRHLRWDERAIDLWLDSQMPEVLQKVAGTDYAANNNPRDEQAEMAKRLQNRAKGIAHDATL